jgi:hypothetical protein
MDPFDLPSFDILEAAFDDDDDDSLTTPYEGPTICDDSLYDPLPINYISDDTEPLILSSSVASVLTSSVTDAGTGKVQIHPPAFFQTTAASEREKQMADYTEALSKIAAVPPVTPKTLKTKKQQTYKSKRKARPEVMVKGLVKPKKPLGAYGVFQQHQRVKLFSTTDVDFDDMDLAISLQWKQLGEGAKQYYQDQAVKEKEDYQKAMIEYRKKRLSLLNKKKASTTPKAQSQSCSPLIIEPILITPHVSSGDLSYQNSVDAMSTLADKLGYQATQDLIHMFS